MNRHSALDSMFLPESIAVIGATALEGSVGRTVVENLAKGFSRERLYAINPKREEVLGLRCYQNLASVPEKVDLASRSVVAPQSVPTKDSGSRRRASANPIRTCGLLSALRPR